MEYLERPMQLARQGGTCQSISFVIICDVVEIKLSLYLIELQLDIVWVEWCDLEFWQISRSS